MGGGDRAVTARAPSPRARFDDMERRRTLLLDGFVRELRADTLDAVVDVLRAAEAAALHGHVVAGYVAYDAAPAFDPGLRVPEGRGQVGAPLAWFGVFRHARESELRLPVGGRAESDRWRIEAPREEHVLRVKSALDEIARGNTYQVNLTSPVLNRRAGDARALYRRLLQAQRPAYAALLEFEGLAIVSASPELFFSWDGATLASRPMKGTARRGRWREEDDAAVRALVASPKERAENVMIVDLIRNDVGKVAEVGSVRVPALCRVEPYPNVWQMVSDVECSTRRGVNLVDIFAAMFPCGSVTGAPKRSSMGIIADTETTARGVYCGAVGILRARGEALDARFNVAIRTAVVDTRRGTAVFGSGGGIVADSEPDAEYRELVLKAAMLNSALGGRFRLLETFRFTPGGENANLARHLARISHSARVLGFRVPPDLHGLVARGLARVTTESRVRLLLARDGRLEVQLSDAPAPSADPVRLAVDDEPVSSQWALLYHKSTQRGLSERRRRRHPDADDVVMVNERGECTEVTTATIAVRRGTRWLTPPIVSGCLPGVERARLLDEGHLVEAVLTVADLADADEIVVVNSLRGWRPAVLV